MKLRAELAFGLMLALASPATAGWTVVAKGQPVAVAKSALTVTPHEGEWVKASGRPSKKGEAWTIDGMALNELAFFGGIANGETLLKDRQKKTRPLPTFSSTMLLPDVVQLFESSYRLVLGTSVFKTDSVEPIKFAGRDGVRFTYSYTVKDEDVRRRGEARAAVVDGKLYLVSFAAPEIHYFDATIAAARDVMDSARL